MCAHAVRVAVEKLPGVTGAHVSLEDGRVTVRLAPENELAIADLRRAIRDQGFSPRGAEVRVSGRLEEGDDGPILRVPGSGVAYSLRADEDLLARLREATGRDVLLQGRVAEDEDGTTPTRLQVSSVAGP